MTDTEIQVALERAKRYMRVTEYRLTGMPEDIAALATALQEARAELEKRPSREYYLTWADALMKANDKRDLALEAVRAVEWCIQTDDDHQCPRCSATCPGPHTPDCLVGRARGATA